MVSAIACFASSGNTLRLATPRRPLQPRSSTRTLGTRCTPLCHRPAVPSVTVAALHSLAPVPRAQKALHLVRSTQWVVQTCPAQRCALASLPSPPPPRQQCRCLPPPAPRLRCTPAAAASPLPGIQPLYDMCTASLPCRSSIYTASGCRCMPVHTFVPRLAAGGAARRLPPVPTRPPHSAAVPAAEATSPPAISHTTRSQVPVLLWRWPRRTCSCSPAGSPLVVPPPPLPSQLHHAHCSRPARAAAADALWVLAASLLRRSTPQPSPPHATALRCTALFPAQGDVWVGGERHAGGCPATLPPPRLPAGESSARRPRHAGAAGSRSAGPAAQGRSESDGGAGRAGSWAPGPPLNKAALPQCNA